MKKSLFPWLLLMSLLILSSCGAIREDSTASQWLADANLSAEETPEQLYAQALEEGVLTIYTVSSRLVDVAAAFEAEYPGLSVEVIYARTEDMVEQLVSDKDADNITADLVFLTNGSGSITEELIPDGLVQKYLPYDMEDVMLEGLSDSYVSVMVEVPMLVYSTQSFDSAPVANWWALTEPQWADKVYITNPSDSMISYTFFAMLQQNSDLLETAYAQYYGTDYVEKVGATIFETFLRGLVNNGLHIVNDSDDVANGIEYGEGVVGLMNASKIRYNADGYHFALCYDMAPFSGVANPAAIMLVDGAPNVASAKLFIRYILGEADGQGEGLSILLANEGIWPARTDAEGLSPSLSTFAVLSTDEDFSAQYRNTFLTLWTEILAALD